MERASKRTRQKLSQDISFENEYSVVELSSALPEHKLVWALNKALKTDFRRTQDLPVFNTAKSATELYPLFLWPRYEMVNYYLCSVITDNSLFPTTFVIVQGPERKEDIQAFIEKTNAMDKEISLSRLVSFFGTNNPAASKNAKERRFMDNLIAVIVDLELHLSTLHKKKKSASPEY